MYEIIDVVSIQREICNTGNFTLSFDLFMILFFKKFTEKQSICINSF